MKKTIIKEYTGDGSLFWNAFAKIAQENDGLSKAAMKYIPNTAKVICDFGCGNGKNINIINNIFSPQYIIAVDNSKDQLISAIKNTTIQNVKFSETINCYLNEIDVVFAKHVFVAMENDVRKKIAKELFDAMSPGAKLIIAETNLEEHVKHTPDIYGMAMQTKCEAYPHLDNAKDGDIVNTILKLKENLAECEEGKTQMTLQDRMHTIRGMQKLLTAAGFIFDGVSYVDSKNIQNAYVIYIARKPLL